MSEVKETKVLPVHVTAFLFLDHLECDNSAQIYADSFDDQVDANASIVDSWVDKKGFIKFIKCNYFIINLQRKNARKSLRVLLWIFRIQLLFPFVSFERYFLRSVDIFLLF